MQPTIQEGSWSNDEVDRFLSAEEAAGIVGIATDLIALLAARGFLRRVVTPSGIRFRLRDIVEFAQRRSEQLRTFDAPTSR